MLRFRHGSAGANVTLVALAVCSACVLLAVVPLAIVLSLAKDPQILTILPLGDSITAGYRSEDGNGYRLSLSHSLAKAGFGAFNCSSLPGSLQPNPNRPCQPPFGWRRAHRFVGSQVEGSMKSNRHEGHNGFTISEIQAISTPVLESYCGPGAPRAEGVATEEPDVVLLMAGTNDVVSNPLDEDINQAPKRLQGLIEFVGTKCPKASVIVAQIVPSNDSMPSGKEGGAIRVSLFNAELPGLVHDLRSQGRNVSLVNMGEVVATTQLLDGVHPDEAAYQRMGSVWWHGMHTVLPLLSGTGNNVAKRSHNKHDHQL